MSLYSARRFCEPHDFVPSPPEVIDPIANLLGAGARFFEPAAGNGSLVHALEARGLVCIGASDIAPRADWIAATPVAALPVLGGTAITNPPWSSRLLVPFALECLRVFDEVWLLLPHRAMANRWFDPLRAHHVGHLIVGRVRWLPGSPMDGKEDCAWYRLDREPLDQPFSIGPVHRPRGWRSARKD